MKNKKLEATLRWISLVPGAIAAGALATMAVTFFQKLGFVMNGNDPDKSFWFMLINATIGNGVGSIALVRAAELIAPKKKHQAAYAVGILGVMITGSLLFLSIYLKRPWPILGFGTMIGVLVYEMSRVRADEIREVKTMAVPKMDTKFSRN